MSDKYTFDSEYNFNHNKLSFPYPYRDYGYMIMEPVLNKMGKSTIELTYFFSIQSSEEDRKNIKKLVKDRVANMYSALLKEKEGDK